MFVEAGKTGSLVFYLPPLTYIQRESYNASIRMNLRDQRGRTVSQATLSAGHNRGSSLFVGVLGKQAGELKRISNVLDYLTVAGMDPDHLDNLQFAHNFRAIILNSPGSVTLNSHQAANLRRWLEAGGLLIVGGGSSWQQSAALLPSDILPVRMQGVETIAAGDLAPLGLPSLEEGDYTIAAGESVGHVLIPAGEKPLLAAKKVGKGTVLWSALDLEAAPLLNPANSEAFWQKVFMLRPIVKPYFVDSNFVNQLFNSISQDSLAATLSPGKLFLLLLGYIVLVGPINWLVLRRIDRREWAWFVIPAVALLFTTGAFAYGRLGRGSDKVLYQVNLIELYSPKQANFQSLSGVFVPSSKDMTLNSEDYLAPISGEIVSSFDGSQHVLELKKPPLWSVQKFFGAGVLDLPGSVQMEAKLSGKKFEAKIANNSGQDFFASFIKIGGEWCEFGALAAGETKTSTGTSQPNFQSIMSRFNASLSRALPFYFEFSHYLPNTPVFFLGFGDSGAFSVAGANKEVALDIWVQAFEAGDFFAAGSLDIPRGILTPEVMGSDTKEYYSPRDYHFYSQEEANVDLVFSLPENLDFSIGEYRLNLDSLWGESNGTVLAYNYKSNSWQEISSLDNLMKQTRTIFLENPGDLISENHLTVRINYTGDLGFNLDGIDISVTGGRIND